MAEKADLRSDLVVESIENKEHEQVYNFTSSKNLNAIIAVHNTNLGNVCLGGCRMYPYSDFDEMLSDAETLSKEMTYKNALAGLEFGGSKCVISGNPNSEKSDSLLLSMADAINFMNGRIYTGQDSGIGEEDVKLMNQKTPYLVGLKSGNPAIPTALGVYHGMKAASKEIFGDSSLKDKKVALYGVGGVGSNLLDRLFNEGADVVLTDFNSNVAKDFGEKYGFKPVNPKEIFSYGCHIFSPNVTGSTVGGGALDKDRVEKLSGSRLEEDLIIAGSTNVPLADSSLEEKIHYTDGLYLIPPIAINAGGVISVSSDITGESYEEVKQRVLGIGETVSEIIRKSNYEGMSPNKVAHSIAEERVY